MTEVWKWWASRDGETYYVGPCDSRDHVISDARESGFAEDGEDFHICEAKQDPIDFSVYFDADGFLEGADEGAMDDYGGENGPDTFSDDISKEQMHDLEQCVRLTISRWQKRHSIAPKPWVFTSQRNEETITNLEKTDV